MNLESPGTNSYELNRAVTVVIPCRNEAETVPNIIKTYDELDSVSKVVVVDNNSQDETAAVAETVGATTVYEPRTGKGYAVLAGAEEATTDLVFCIDGDIENPSKRWLQMALDKYAVGSDVVRAAPRKVNGQSTHWMSTEFDSRTSVKLASVNTDGETFVSVGSYSKESTSVSSNRCSAGSSVKSELQESATTRENSLPESRRAAISVVDRIQPILQQRYPSVAEMREPLGGIVLFPQTFIEQLTEYVGWDIDIGISITAATNEDIVYTEFEIKELVHAQRTAEWYDSMAKEIIDAIRTK